jgi:hypothetical protein
MDRGIPTEEHLENRRARHIFYLVGTPKGRLTKLEKALATLTLAPSARGRGSQAPGAGPRILCVGAESSARVQGTGHASAAPEMSVEAAQRIATPAAELRDAVAETGNTARKEAGRAWSLVKLMLPQAPPKQERSRRVDFSFALNKAKLRLTRRREGRYLSTMKSAVSRDTPKVMVNIATVTSRMPS